MSCRNRGFRRRLRRGMSTLEVVMTTAVVFPGVVLVAYVGIRACRIVYSLIGTMTGSPLL